MPLVSVARVLADILSPATREERRLEWGKLTKIYFREQISDSANAIILNGVMFAIATTCGQVTLNRHYRPLVASNPLHKVGKRAWLTLYVFVAVQ